MKYKYLKDQNESFKKQIDEQNKLIKSQTILIDKLTSEKIDLLSKLEIKKFNNGGYANVDDMFDLKRMTNEIRIIDELDIMMGEDSSYFWSAINKRVKPFDKTVLVANNFILNAHKNAFTNAIYELANSFKQKHNVEASIKQMTEAMFEYEPKIVKSKSKDWYQKHNNKQRFQGKNK